MVVERHLCNQGLSSTENVMADLSYTVSAPASTGQAPRNESVALSHGRYGNPSFIMNWWATPRFYRTPASFPTYGSSASCETVNHQSYMCQFHYQHACAQSNEI